HIDFPDYNPDELFTIAHLMLEKSQYCLSGDAAAAFKDYIVRRMTMPNFANARSIRNALDRARLRQANRLFEKRGAALSKKDLMTIEPPDILASRVFNEGVPDVTHAANQTN
ncbi:MAG TPA: CbbX protein, partial [Burkholderiales bacterium]|nr:CbbX protein [Burkholderiales bacterium]